LFAYALRGALRRRGRFILSIALLATAGAIFLAAVNTARSWDVVTQRLYTSRHYDFEMGFDGHVDVAHLENQLVATDEIDSAEAWFAVRTAPATGHALPIERTYPDGAHGAFSLVAPPRGSKMVTFDLKEGRLPREDKKGEVVLNQMVPGAEDHSVGDDIELSIGGIDHPLRIVGRVEEVGTGAVAYVTRATFHELVGDEQGAILLRAAKAPNVSIEAAALALGRVLEQEGAPVSYVSPLSVFENAVAAHFEILIRSLMALAGLTALVAAIGLASTLSANVGEMARELAVLRAVGASRRQLGSLVVWESLFVSAASFLIATASGLLLSALLGQVVGMMSFRVPLPLSPQPGAFLLLLLTLIGLGSVASLIPARRASNFTVNRALRAL
jgi:putative ABC transport system permease protein